VKKCSSDTRRLEFYTLARWTTMSRRVFYSPFWRRNSMRIAPVFFGQPCLFLRFLYYYYSLRSQAFDRWRFLPQVRFGFALLRLFDFRLDVLQSCFAYSDLIGVYRYRWSLPVFYVVILNLDFLRCYAGLRAYTYTSSFVLRFHHPTYLWFRSVD
jgi:hypothetical protein